MSYYREEAKAVVFTPPFPFDDHATEIFPLEAHASSKVTAKLKKTKPFGYCRRQVSGDNRMLDKTKWALVIVIFQ